MGRVSQTGLTRLLFVMELPVIPAPGTKGRVIARWVWRVFLVAVLVVALRFVLIPQFTDARIALLSLGHVAIPLLVLGLGLELASICCYTALSWTTLNRSSRPKYTTILRIDLATEGVNNSVPGGGPTATAVKFRMLTLAGATPANAVTGTTMEIATSVLTLGGLFGISIALSTDTVRGNPEYIIAGVVVGAVALLSCLALVLLRRHRELVLALVGRLTRRIPYLPKDASVAFVGTAAQHLDEYYATRRHPPVAVAWAAANWLLDIAALWTFLLAFGYRSDPLHLLVAYGLACLVALVPVTPGGLGIIEGVLVPALVGFGTPHGIALLGVLSWRLVQYWLPIPLAVIAYASLRAGPLRRSSRETDPVRATA